MQRLSKEERSAISRQPVKVTQYIERKPGSDKYRIVGKGITVEFLSTLIDAGVDYVKEHYPLTDAEIYAAWSFYYDNKEEIDARIAAEEAISEARREENRAFQEQWKEERLKRQQEAADTTSS